MVIHTLVICLDDSSPTAQVGSRSSQLPITIKTYNTAELLQRCLPDLAIKVAHSQLGMADCDFWALRFWENCSCCQLWHHYGHVVYSTQQHVPPMYVFCACSAYADVLHSWHLLAVCHRDTSNMMQVHAHFMSAS